MGVIVSEILSANLTDALYTKITNILSVVVERKRLIKHASEIFPRIFFSRAKNVSRGNTISHCNIRPRQIVVSRKLVTGCVRTEYE